MNRLRDRTDAVRAQDIQDAVALQARAIVRVRDEVAARVERIVERDHGSGGVGISSEIPVAEILDGERDQILAGDVLIAGPLAGEEEEYLVAAVEQLGNIDRSSHVRGLEVLALDAVPVRAVKEPIGVQVFIAMLRQERAVELVGP